MMFNSAFSCRILQKEFNITQLHNQRICLIMLRGTDYNHIKLLEKR